MQNQKCFKFNYFSLPRASARGSDHTHDEHLQNWRILQRRPISNRWGNVLVAQTPASSINPPTGRMLARRGRRRRRRRSTAKTRSQQRHPRHHPRAAPPRALAPEGGTAVGNDDAPAAACADAEARTQACATRARASGARRNARNPDGTPAQSPTTEP